eukprot:645457-Hanusia_phi.AAC.1
MTCRGISGPGRAPPAPAPRAPGGWQALRAALSDSGSAGPPGRTHPLLSDRSRLRRGTRPDTSGTFRSRSGRLSKPPPAARR